ncbi:LOW QUALITY PROTEIN: proactivator polypeptide-like 1 [Megaptera novaeangliae]
MSDFVNPTPGSQHGRAEQLLLGTTPAGSISGPEECKGSAVRHRDLQVATRCGSGVGGHCRSTAWSQPTAKCLPCAVCLDVAAAASNGLNPEAMETDLAVVMKKTPSQESSAKCKGTVDAHGSTILSVLGGAPGSAPAQVCQPLRRLPATPRPLSEEDTSEVVVPRIPVSTRCQGCVWPVTRPQDAVGPKLSNRVEVTTREQCESLGPGLTLLCENYICQLFAPPEQTLRLMPPNETCRKEGFCEEPKERAHLAHAAAVDRVPWLALASPRKKGEVQRKAGVPCEVCLQVVQKPDRRLEPNSSKVVSRALERVCSVLPAPVAQKCVSSVDAYGPSLVELLTRANAEKLCTCTRLYGRWRRAWAAHEGPTTLPPPPLGKENQGSFCSGGKWLLGMSAHNLQQQSTKRRILRAFKGVCRILPLPLMVQCDHLLTDYQPVLIETLGETMDPTALCAKMAYHAPTAALLGTDRSILAPSFWCKSQGAAETRGSAEHCQSHEPYKVDRSKLTALPPPSALPQLSIPVPWLTVRGAWRWPLGPPLHLADGS